MNKLDNGFIALEEQELYAVEGGVGAIAVIGLVFGIIGAVATAATLLGEVCEKLGRRAGRRDKYGY